ncbi:DASH family cryptochrome [Muricauda sp. JGD-17]|uniref:Cryptochrome DASH n=1 Tax=Flagellimonas ochracea TaxID=2696472 RepID=A0A964WXT4_9FLAO|nr:DASH family cryptochrome [Allomuricauda ochracea]NAY92486.1 DASH family cryptochrome [Allomuricauda ochracea]
MQNNLIWFRNDLRVSDNHSIMKAFKGDKVIAVYFFDPRHYETSTFGFKKTEKFRAKFLLQTVTQLRGNLQRLNITLFVYHAKPEAILPNLVSDHQIDTIFLQKEWTSEEIKVLHEVRKNLGSKISFVETFGQFLFHPEDIPYPTYQTIPNVFTHFRKKCEKVIAVRPTLPAIQPKGKYNLVENDTVLPSLKELGLEDFETDSRSAFPFKGGENEAKKRLENYFWETKKLAFYKRTRNGLIGTDYSSKFSPWLANGSISPRTIYWEVKKFEDQIEKNKDTYWLIFELIWRDFFKYISLKYGNQIFRIEGILDKIYSWGSDEKTKNAWIGAQTEDPFVNANMEELRFTGWMSNRGRQNVASYWSKHLEQDWRIGAAYFESLLLDYDVHSNWGNWMYNSGVGNDPRNRKFNTRRQAEMYDPNGKFQKLWLQPTLF